jgi:hypothetical protein
MVISYSQNALTGDGWKPGNAKLPIGVGQNRQSGDWRSRRHQPLHQPLHERRVPRQLTHTDDPTGLQ